MGPVLKLCTQFDSTELNMCLNPKYNTNNVSQNFVNFTSLGEKGIFKKYEHIVRIFFFFFDSYSILPLLVEKNSSSHIMKTALPFWDPRVRG